MADSTDDLLRKWDKEWQENWFPPGACCLREPLSEAEEDAWDAHCDLLGEPELEATRQAERKRLNARVLRLELLDDMLEHQPKVIRRLYTLQSITLGGVIVILLKLYGWV